MKNKLFSSVLISLAFPVCHAAGVSGDSLNIGFGPGGNLVAAGTYSGSVGDGNEIDEFSLGAFSNGSYNTIAKSEGGVVLGGYNSLNQDNYSLVAGFENHITTATNQRGNANILLGANNTLNKASAPYGVFSTVLIGNGNSASTPRAWVIGQGNIGQTDTVTLGTYASEVTAASLIVGTGTATNLRSNGLVVLKDGRVQIPGSLEVGGAPALTTTTAATAGYLKNGSNATGSSAVALGFAAQATGAGSYALGSISQSLGTSSFAIGDRAEARADHSFAAGHYSLASGEFSAAIGYGSQATGQLSLALGGGKSSGVGAVSFTSGNATGDNSFATMGHTASGYGSVVLAGYSPSSGYSTASGAGASVFGGLGSVASGDVSFAAGYQTTTSAAHSTAFGSRNLSAGTGLVPADHTSWVETESLFELGNGRPSLTPAQYSNAITTLKNGRTTLSNKFWVSTTPEVVPTATEASAGDALVVEGHTELKGNTKLKGDTTLSGKVTLEQTQGDISMGIYQ